jgi:S1-C subfamily serine protease
VSPKAAFALVVDAGTDLSAARPTGMGPQASCYKSSVELPDVIDQIRRSSVQIQFPTPSGARPRILGSGFCVVDGRHVVTARHVLANGSRHIGAAISVGLPLPDFSLSRDFTRSNFLPWDAICVGISEDDDLALLELQGKLPIKARWRDEEQDPRLWPLTLSEEEVRDGERVAISGYPLAHPTMVTTTGIIASAWSTDPAETAAYGSRHLVDVTTNPGNSGGPCYRAADGVLIGALIAGRMAPVAGAAGHYASGLSVIVPTVKIRGLIAESGI